MSDHLMKALCGTALALIAGAWFGAVAGALSWHLNAPALPDRAWGQQFASEIFPEAQQVRVDLIPEVAQYEEAGTQEERLGFFLFGGDDYYPGQLIVTARVNAPREVIAGVGPLLQRAGWTVGSHTPGEDVTAASDDLTLWVTDVQPDGVEVSVYRQTPAAVRWATGTAWLTGVLLGALLGARRGRKARARSRATSFFALGAALSLPAAIITSATLVAHVFTADDTYPLIPWEAYMYAILRPLAILGFAALCVAAVLIVKERGKARTAPAEPMVTN
ncbi:hypothetical protein [Actinoplanes missouriensis]